jgi:cation/acetate symporter
MLLAYKLGYFWVLPQFGYGQGMTDLSTEFGINISAPFSHFGLFQWTALCFTLMFGTAGLPHVLSRFYTVSNIRDARWSVVWGLFFIALIYWSAPAYAIFGRLIEARNGIFLPPEVSYKMADIVVLRTALLGGIPLWIVGMLAAGAVSAAFFTVAGLLMTGASSVSYDIYYRIINSQATESQRMSIAKGSTLLLAFIVMLGALKPPGLIVEIAAVAFALAGNTIFPAFLLGIWWSETNKAGVISGMLAGLFITFSQPLFGGLIPAINSIFPFTASALCGAPVVIIIMISVSLFTKPPSEEIRRFLAEEVHGEVK